MTMNILSVDSKTHAVKELTSLMVGGFENPEDLSGSVLLKLDGYANDVGLTFSDTLLAEEGHELDEGGFDAVIRMPVSTAERIIFENSFVDFRMHSLMSTMQLSGNQDLINHLSYTATRPSEDTTDRLKKSEELHAEKNYQNLEQIERIDNPSQLEILELMEEGLPCVIRFDLENLDDWSPAKLIEQYGDEVVLVSAKDEQQNKNIRECIAEMENMSGSAKVYTSGCSLPVAMRDNFGPILFNPDDFIEPQLWLGRVSGAQPTSSLHRDPLTGFLLQVIGHKKLELFSADQAGYLYPKKGYNNYQPCWVNPQQPDLARYPLFAKAKKLSVVLEPGECLLQPAGWFHQVYAVDDSPNMSVSYFWRY